MKSSAVAGLEEVDWCRPWLAPLREHGQALARRAREHASVEALNDDARLGSAMLAAGRLRFVAQTLLPAGEAYEAFIARTACVPTRHNLHDLFNGLLWLAHPALKRRLNELQSGQLALAGVSGRRGAVRDALTLFDENGAWWQAPPVLADALQRRDWHDLFITHRAAWGDARPTLFGHALIEKLTRPRKPIAAHVWLVPQGMDAEAFLLGALTVERLATRPYLPLPVLGVPGWWAGNEAPGFYRDEAVFRI